ncbi:CPBP family intramembrane glutamic endopeptidase [Saccharibacillus alkalitolerans]|uniref:CPBP family intramembrane metalloprotease n=1 Tax=Saccharibacillus alkalitolerans TaxID=2705290 RepID=A0ABX0F3A5_9BACL|nr:type II CAAX endopeptidase family protein [Saccharibacillus alkalitolerans]NGZ74355.1 CPBP family intramembrane metalloprotease [Saccharibacillus alkalitolerans]
MNESATRPPLSNRKDSKIAAFFRYPLVWMPLGFVLLVLCSGLLSPPFGSTDIPAVVLLSLLSGIVCSAAYFFIMKVPARRRVPELALSGAGKETLLGIGAGLLFIGVSVLIISALGGYSFRWAPSLPTGALLAGLLFFASAALFEELVFRGLLVQGIERLGGSWIALALTSLFFGAVHLANPNATLLSALAIAVEAGLLLGAAFLWRRNLWFVTGLHFAWNSCVSLLGIPVSGLESSGLFEVKVQGPDLLTGGAFGIEGSIVPVVIGLTLTLWVLFEAKKSGRLIPFRRRREERI